jgi:hypothetical protein
LVGSRNIVFDISGPVAARVFEWDRLEYNNVIYGPAVIEGVTATALVPPGDVVTVGRFGSLVLKIGVAL